MVNLNIVQFNCPYEKDYLVCDLPNKSELYTVQLHVVKKYMDVAFMIMLFINKKTAEL